MPDVFSFAPAVKEREPLVPEPSPELAAQGMACYGFDSGSWANFRYLGAPKALQVGAPFQQLNVNPQLGSSGSSCDRLYSQMDQMLGTLSLGLLLQRKVFADAMQALISAHLSAGTDVHNLFASSGYALKPNSDDLVQYVFGKRFAVIEARRKLFEPSDPVMASQLHAFPPSARFLFNEAALGDLLRQNPPVGRPPSLGFRHRSSRNSYR